MIVRKNEDRLRFLKRHVRLFICTLLVVTMTLGLSMVALAADGASGEQTNTNWLPRLVDNADLLSNEEEQSLLAQLDEISERQQCDVVIVTVDSLDGNEGVAYADDFYDYNGYGFGQDREGVLLLVCMGEREYAISTTGFGIDALTDYGLAYIEDQFLPDLSEGNYSKSFGIFANCCDQFIAQAKTGTPYDTNYEVGDANDGISFFKIIKYLLISCVIGFAIALIMATVKKSSLKTVAKKTQAAEYMKDFNLTRKHDQYIRSNTTSNTVSKSSETRSGGGGSSTHVGSSGTSHGGSSGKF